MHVFYSLMFYKWCFVTNIKRQKSSPICSVMKKIKKPDRELKKSNGAYKDANTKLVLVNSCQQAYDIEREMKLNEFALDIARDSLLSMMDELDLTTLE
ncbi:hypothetical protein F2Q70_00000176 [Brassica cretica]|uniref:MADS-box domain-containing protein n=2 Tax=Brassica cretica TaxID=69181 RepID=A0ABQ7CPD8_BRACR|nr:hypothetical protein F2Q68_00018672 [Brassica cretica]KAF2576046.1 hypothetical protein F2Q70_00000176 [Brassica cretica]KAF3561876.1 hypothetical protein DY000_02010975 [Brassica cretica]KAF3561882.1 hypothetical protein DY000_02010973 [Brassica cretica]